MRFFVCLSTLVPWCYKWKSRRWRRRRMFATYNFLFNTWWVRLLQIRTLLFFRENAYFKRLLTISNLSLGRYQAAAKITAFFFSYNHHSYQPQLYVEPKSCYIFSKLTYSFSKGQNIQVNVTLIYTHLEITFFIGTSFPVTTKSVADNKGQKWQKLPKIANIFKFRRFESYLESY